MHHTQHQPIQLIHFQDNRFQITEQAKLFLKSFQQSLGVVTIVGKYRTGKSLFMNKVLLKNPSAFKVCPTINSCTKGLWMWKESIKSENAEEVDVIVIDTEGFGATQQTEAYNNKILLFALLLSSYFIYNSVGSIDENSLNNLNVLGNLAREIQAKNANNQNIGEEFPSFLWVVRDFSLNLVDKNGSSIESKQYLEQALQIQKGSSAAIEGKNKIRKMIKHFFRDRDCFTLIRPVEAEEKLQKLDTLEDNEFRPEFLEQIDILRSKILKKVKGKKIKGKVLDGEMLLELALGYVDVINSGSLPNFDSSFKHLMRIQMNKTVENVLKVCQFKLKQSFKSLLSPEEILHQEEELIKFIEKELKQKIFDGEQLTSNLVQVRKQMQGMLLHLKKENQIKCQELFLQIFDNISAEVHSAQFMHYDHIQEQSKHFKHKLMAQITNMRLPIDFDKVNQHFYSWKSQIYFEFSKYSQQHTRDITTAKQSIISELQQSLSLQKNNVKEITFQNHQLSRQVIRLEGKAKEIQSIKSIEIGYLQERQRENQQEIKCIFDKNESQVSEIQNLKRAILEYQMKNDQNIKSLKQLSEDKRLVQKELQLIKSNLQRKHEENCCLRVQLSEAEAKVENLFERENHNNSRVLREQSQKDKDYVEIQRKYESAQKEIIEINKLLTKTQSENQCLLVLTQKQKNIYQNMFESLKDSIKIEHTTNQELVETITNISASFKKLEKRVQQTEEKEKHLKEYKKCVKNSSCLQCQNCTKFFVPSIFLPHLNVCLIGPQSIKGTKIDKLNEKYRIEIKIKQTLVKEIDHKPFTEYVIECKRSGESWTINRKYKEFCDLNSSLKAVLPGVQLSDVSYIANPHEGSKKSLVIEERRKVLQKYLNDLSSNPLVSKTVVWKEFIECPSQNFASYNSVNSSPLKQNTKMTLNYPLQSPEQFLKLWNERNLRVKETSMNFKGKAPH